MKQNWDYKRILQYVVSIRVFTFAVMICYSYIFYKIKKKKKRLRKKNFVKSLNTVKSIFNGYTITTPLQIHLDFGKKPLQIKER